MAKRLITLRLDANLAEWSRTLLGEDTRTTLVETLLQAVQERRLVVFAYPLPVESNLGNNPEVPVLVSTNE